MYRIAPYYNMKVGIGERARSALAPTMMCVVEAIKQARARAARRDCGNGGLVTLQNVYIHTYRIYMIVYN